MPVSALSLNSPTFLVAQLFFSESTIIRKDLEERPETLHPRHRHTTWYSGDPHIKLRSRLWMRTLVSPSSFFSLKRISSK
jgi:hypothetical protein